MAPSARDFHEMSSQHLIRDHCFIAPLATSSAEAGDAGDANDSPLVTAMAPTLSWSLETLESLMRASGHQPRPLEPFHVCSLVTAPALAQGSALHDFMSFRNTL